MKITKEIFDKYKKTDGNWRSYINGNYIVNINLDDGTKERIQPDDDADFIPEFPESLDINLTMKCSGGCKYCYQGCTPDGKEGDIRNAKIFDTLKPYTEVALQVNELDHPDLMWLLYKLKEKKIIVNITVNQIHFMTKNNLIRFLVDNNLIKGLGISYVIPSDSFIREVKKFPNAVLHVINGVITEGQLKPLYDNNLKILILGYKDLGRGIEYKHNMKQLVNEKQKWLYDNLTSIIDHFHVVSFDNLALEQLNVKRLLSKEQWDSFYMGDDGTFTFYIDLVNQTFGESSLVTHDKMMPIKDDVIEMFRVITKNKNILT